MSLQGCPMLFCAIFCSILSLNFELISSMPMTLSKGAAEELELEFAPAAVPSHEKPYVILDGVSRTLPIDDENNDESLRNLLQDEIAQRFNRILEEVELVDLPPSPPASPRKLRRRHNAELIHGILMNHLRSLISRLDYAGRR